jgi:ABC-type transport system involved in multi-copper enzyme maturation permease subunit
VNKRATLILSLTLVGALIGLAVSTNPLIVALLASLGAAIGAFAPVGKLAEAGPHLGFAEYAWRLIPANPILLRVVESGGKKRRDLFIRCGYLGLLVFVVIGSLMSSGGSIAGTDLSALAKESAAIFQRMSYLQLGLVALLAPIFTAGAITQEKDSQTYDILLATPLTNGQIVLGSLLSRLFFVVALLVSGIPIFSITQIFGGVAINSIVMSFAIAAATAFVTGALAMAIAVLKVGTRRTIFSFYLFIVLYLVGGWLLDKLPVFKFTLADGSTSTTSWLTGLHPFLSLEVIFNNPAYAAPADVLALPEDLRGRIVR